MQRVIALVLLVGLVSCAAPSCSTNTPPETTVARYSGTVLGAATELQKGITAATDAKILPVPIAQKLTGYVDVIYQKSGPMLAALKVYHATTDLANRKVQAADIQQAITDINGAITGFLGTAIPQGALQELNKLVGNVMVALGAVQAEVAKGLGGGNQ